MILNKWIPASAGMTEGGKPSLSIAYSKLIQKEPTGVLDKC